MSSPPQPRPEGELIKRAMKRKRLSARKAATAAGMSEGRWRQIVNGYQHVSAGQTMAVTGPADTVARMALVVDLAPEDLAGVGREDAAEELRILVAEKPAAPAPASPEKMIGELEPWQQDVIAGALSERPRSPRERALLLRALAEKWERQAQEQEAEGGTLSGDSV
ncbi:helix-turn-helix domain-containing protein [Streptomyces sp. NPDC087851]|uniref:helix-turn-helix domain-containing protein n=1 Tax=Streptomyces sp. NPDC087851 TaxID=3365810 RepID=UPI00382C17D0